MSRTESFLLWAENHPQEVAAAMDDRAEALVRELEAKEEAAARALRGRSCARRRAVLEDAPF